MGFATRKPIGTEPLGNAGRVYVLRVTLDDGTIVHKLGMCHSPRSVGRMMEILQSFFNQYRYIPHCELRRDKPVVAPLLVEKHMHELLGDLSYRFDKKFGGSTEFFSDVDEDLLLEYLDAFDYRELLKCTEMKTEDHEAICNEINKQKPKDTTEDEIGDILPF